MLPFAAPSLTLPRFAGEGAGLAAFKRMRGLVVLFTSTVTFARSLTVAARIGNTRPIRAARVSKRCGAAADTSP